MNTISTLCATTTVGAAALGYAFGVPQNPAGPISPVSASSRTGLEGKAERRWSSSRLQPRSMSGSTPSPQSTSQTRHTRKENPCISPSANKGESLPFRSHLTQELGPEHKDKAIQAGRHLNRTVPSRQDAEQLVLPRRRTRPASWAVSSTPYNRSVSNPQSTSNPIPENVASCANSASNMTNNRSSSQHNRSASGNLLGISKVWTRSDIVQPSPLPIEAPIQIEKENAYANTSGSSHAVQPRLYKHYFTVTLEHDSDPHKHQQTRQTGHIRKIRRIQPNSRHKPTLMLADSVAAPDTLDELTGARRDLSRLESKNNSPLSTNSPLPSSSGYESSTTDRESRRSFSISDILSRSMSFRRHADESENSSRKYPRPLSQRITSAPLFGEQKVKSAERNGNTRSAVRGEYLHSDALNGRRAVSGPVIQGPTSNGTRSEYSEVTNPQSHVPYSPTHSWLSTKNGAALGEFQSPIPSSSFGPGQLVSQGSPHSATLSELSSSRLGSDISGRVFSSCGDDDGDVRSETVYDSLRTETKLVREAFPGNLFDAASSMDVHNHKHNLSVERILLGNSAAYTEDGTNVIDEEEEEFPTPVRRKGTNDASTYQSSPGQKFTTNFDPSQPPSILALRKLDWHVGDEKDPFGWSDEEETALHHQNDTSAEPQYHTTQDFDGTAHANFHSTAADRAPPGQSSNAELEPKINVFDWSEQPLVERVCSTGLPRPKTMHGKKSQDARVSRSSGRRAPSGPHARSQSVPALSDQSESRVGGTSKFGTWGIGSKGATEDWDDDFDFSGPPATSIPEGDSNENGATFPKSIHIPQAIREQQTNVLANIGLLKEWGILIEELKELRQRSTMLGIQEQAFQSTFDEVDAMIDLADQESDDMLSSDPTPSLLAMPDDSLDGQERSLLDQPSSKRASQTLQESINRPRTNSEAVARSVIEAIQQRRGSMSRTPQQSPIRPKPKAKVPFDKGTLKHILPHLVNLVKCLKKILRNAEGFSNSPEQLSKRPIPAFSKAFVVPADESPTMTGRKGLGLDFGLAEEDWDLS